MGLKFPKGTEPIKGFGGFYRIDRNGVVWSCRKRIGIGKTGGKGSWKTLSGTIGIGGYPMVTLTKKLKCYRPHHVHRLVLETFVGPRPNGMECRHLDSNPRNCSLNNLEWNTKLVNQQDRHANRSDNRGERCGLAKLNWKEVRKIRKLYATGKYWLQTLADRYGVSESSISSVVLQKTWKEKWDCSTN